MSRTVRDGPGEARYEIHEDGNLAAFAKYRVHGTTSGVARTECLGTGCPGCVVGDTAWAAQRAGISSG